MKSKSVGKDKFCTHFARIMHAFCTRFAQVLHNLPHLIRLDGYKVGTVREEYPNELQSDEQVYLPRPPSRVEGGDGGQLVGVGEQLKL